MTVKPSDIAWSSYLQYEGPFFLGWKPYVAPQNPSFLEKVMQVICATEGGRYDAINMYDSCVVTVGISQLCLNAHVLEPMLGECHKADPKSLTDALSALPHPVSFGQNAAGQWRFSDSSGEIATRAQMNTAFLGGSSGLKGQWTDVQKDFARRVAAGFANLWDVPAFCQAQLAWSTAALPRYLMPSARSSINANPDQTGWPGALKAAVMSYSANIPLTTANLLAKATSDPAWATASDQDKFTMAMHQVVLGSGIAIWPIRYRAIQPVIQRLWGVPVPTLDELVNGHPNPPVVPGQLDPLGSTAGIQRFLISQGYDLGPSGADGIFGKMTKSAVMAFQMKSGLTPTGVVDKATHDAMMKAMHP